MRFKSEIVQNRLFGTVKVRFFNANSGKKTKWRSTMDFQQGALDDFEVLAVDHRTKLGKIYTYITLLAR